METEIELTEFRPVGANQKSVFSRLPHYDLVTFLSIAQRLGYVHFLDLSVKFNPGDVRRGSRTLINTIQVSEDEAFIFKRMDGSMNEVDAFKAAISELVVYEHIAVRTHPKIQRLYGLVWDVHPKTGRVLPAFVFRKSLHGDLEEFLTQDGRSLSFRDKIKLCLDIGSAYEMLHSLSKSLLQCP